MSLGYLDQEDDLEDNLDPYSSISSRPPLENISLDGIALQNQGSPDVRSTIASRKGLQLPAAPPMNVPEDPLQKDIDQFRGRKQEMDRASNIGQIAAQAARGSSTPEASDGLYKNLNLQSNQLLKSKEEDLDRRQKIMAAIEGRKSRETIAAGNQQLREALSAANQAQKTNSRGIQTKRLLGQTEQQLRNDPIAKASETNLASLQKSQAVLDNTAVPLTSQLLSDAEQDQASAMQLRGQGATEGKISRTELVTLGRKLAEARQKWGNQIVDLRKEEPELVNQIKMMNQALIDDYKVTIRDRKSSILDDRDAIYGDDADLARGLGGLRSNLNKRYPVPAEKNSGGGVIPSAHAGDNKKPVKRLYSPSRNQTKLIYSDGSEVVVDGKQ